jgi:hypothetical protein
MKTVLLVVSALILTASVRAQQQPPVDIVKVGRATVERLDRREYAAIHATFNPRLQKVLSEEKLRVAWEKVQGKAGRLRTIGEPTMKTKNGLRHLVYPAQFEQRSVDVEVVFNTGGEVSGVLFHPKR